MWLWTWLLNACLSVFRYFLVKYKGCKFDHDAKTACEQKTNRETLFKILEHNKSTKFLVDQFKKSKLDSNKGIQDVETFK